MKLTLKWTYVSGAQFEHTCRDSIEAGQMYNMKANDVFVSEVYLLVDGIVVIQYKKT
jgi:hypothetical protein